MKLSYRIAVFAAMVGLSVTAVSEIVSKDIGDPSLNVWKPGEWVTCGGEVIAIDERPADAPAGAKALRFETRYAARAFGGWNVAPKNNVLPGKPVKLAGWVRLGNDMSSGYNYNFIDANTNRFTVAMTAPSEGGNKPQGIKLSTQWQKFELVFPDKVKSKDNQMVPLKHPLKIESFSQNNWGDRNNPNAVTRKFDIYDLRLFTDMEGIAPADRPFGFEILFPVIGNVFFHGEDEVVMDLSASSWIGEKKTLRFNAEIEDAYGVKTKLDIKPMEVLDSAVRKVKLPCDMPGAYTVRLSVEGFPKKVSSVHRYVVCISHRTLTDEEKDASSYGINVHGGGYVGYEKFARLGFTWVRDYAYTYSWMVRARGEGGYSGWPWYPKIVKAAEDVGLKTLPCLMGAVRDKDPDLDWRVNLAQIACHFRGLSAFELDNEADNLMFRHFDAYAKCCQVFGEVMKATRPDALAVSPGLAGIYVEQTKKLVEGGYFKDIDVVNGHRYCGKDGPEYSKANLNTGMSEAKPAYLRDVWRHWKRAACCDGKFRQLWVTEWGWDTLAGQPVSEWEQAAYLPRKWVLAMGNGVEKMFWYWYYDSDTDNPQHFFDGCGIFNRYREPKPSAASFATMRAFIPAEYEYIGTANFGPNHMAQIVRADGKIVALAYKIKKSGPDLVIRDEKAELITDMFGRPLKRGERKLDIAPTWYVGLDADSDWLKQCPMDLESDFYVRNVGGEPIRVKVTGPDKFKWSANPPEGWTAERKPYGFDITGPVGLKRGNTSFTVTGTNGKVSKIMSVEVDIVPQAYAKSYAAAFDGEFKMEVTNQSADDQDFTVRAALPKGWKVEPAITSTGVLKPEETKTLSFKLVESSLKRPATSPRLEIVNGNGLQVDYAPITPRRWAMKKVNPAKISLDGNLDDWSEANRLDSFMVGPNGDKDASRFYFGWCEKGLLIAYEVDDSNCFTADPRSFWRATDCLEVQLTTPAGVKFKENAPWSVYDHQFWFCAMKDEKRVYPGFWGNCKEQKILHDVKDIKNALKTTARGYAAEIFIPAERLEGWNRAKVGGEMALSFTLAVQGSIKERELYWPSSKREQSMKKPWTWARVKLED